MYIIYMHKKDYNLPFFKYQNNTTFPIFTLPFLAKHLHNKINPSKDWGIFFFNGFPKFPSSKKVPNFHFPLYNQT